jgi:hypothetical protein
MKSIDTIDFYKQQLGSDFRAEGVPLAFLRRSRATSTFDTDLLKSKDATRDKIRRETTRRGKA